MHAPLHVKHASQHTASLRHTACLGASPRPQRVLPVYRTADEGEEHQRAAARQQHLKDRDAPLPCSTCMSMSTRASPSAATEALKGRAMCLWHDMLQAGTSTSIHRQGPAEGTPRRLAKTSIVARKHELSA